MGCEVGNASSLGEGSHISHQTWWIISSDIFMRITVLLGGPLRSEAGEKRQQFELELRPESRVEDLLPRLGLSQDRIKMIMVNGRGATLDTAISEGDRVALFPPELAFNTFVSLGFRKESVEKREKQSE
jgi:molybdopterin converting factor small subunit